MIGCSGMGDVTSCSPLNVDIFGTLDSWAPAEALIGRGGAWAVLDVSPPFVWSKIGVGAMGISNNERA